MKYKLIMVVVLLLSCVSCSSSDEEQQAATETTQEKIGREAAEQIKATINSAEMARQIQDQHNQQVQDLLEQQKKSE